MRVRITRSTMLVLWCLVVQIAGLTPLPILAASGGGRAGALTAVQHPVATTMSSASAAPATSALTDTAMAIATPIPAHIQTRVASVTATISDTVSVSGAHPVSAPTPYAAISAAARLFDFDWAAASHHRSDDDSDDTDHGPERDGAAHPQHNVQCHADTDTSHRAVFPLAATH